jgi:hypothetical protein
MARGEGMAGPIEEGKEDEPGHGEPGEVVVALQGGLHPSRAGGRVVPPVDLAL